MTLLDLLDAATESFHPGVTDDATRLVGSDDVGDYRRFLAMTYGFLRAVERQILDGGRLAESLDARRFVKHDLVRRDLIALGMTDAEIEALPQCEVPTFETAEQALGWLFAIEHGTRAHASLLRRLAAGHPHRVGFAASFLKCSFGTGTELWRELAVALAIHADSRESSCRLLDAARTAFRTHATWRASARTIEAVR